MPRDDGVYRPPKISPTIMEDDKMSKQERNTLRREKKTQRRANDGYMKDLIDDMEGRLEKISAAMGITRTTRGVVFHMSSYYEDGEEEAETHNEVKKWVTCFD